MHDILIGGLIAIIVIAQILVALNTSRKIALFKAIIPKDNSFETIKVFIPENQIKTVKIDSIFENLEKYTEIPIDTQFSFSNHQQLDQDAKNETVLEDTNKQSHFDASEDFSDELEFDYDEDTEFATGPILITIVKGNEVKRIDQDDLAIFLENGWSRHNF